MQLDDVVMGKADFRTVIDDIAGEADRLITVLRQHDGATVDLSQPAPLRHQTRAVQDGAQEPLWRACSGYPRCGETQGPPAAQSEERLATTAEAERRQVGRPEPMRPTSDRPTPPTHRMVAFAKRLARNKRATPAIRL